MREISSGATRALGLQHLAQHAVHAEADDQAVLVGLDVDVGGVLLDRLRQHGVDQADDRGVVLALHEVGRLRQALGEPGEVRLALDALDDLAGLAAAAFVGLAQEFVEGGLRDALDHQRDAEEAAQLRDGRGLRAFAVDDLGLAVGDAAHQHAVPLREREGQATDRRDRLGRHPRDHRAFRVTRAGFRPIPRPRAAAGAGAFDGSAAVSSRAPAAAASASAGSARRAAAASAASSPASS